MRIRQKSLKFIQKVFVCFLIQAFLLSQAAFALNADEKYQKQKKLQQDNQSESSEINLAQAEVVTTGYSGLATQGAVSAETNEDNVDFGGVADGLVDCDLSTKSMILKASGANESEAATALMGKGDTAENIAGALVEAGYDEQKVQAFLGNIIKTEQQDAQNNQPVAVSENITNIVSEASDTQTSASEQNANLATIQEEDTSQSIASTPNDLNTADIPEEISADEKRLTKIQTWKAKVEAWSQDKKGVGKLIGKVIAKILGVIEKKLSKKVAANQVAVVENNPDVVVDTAETTQTVAVEQTDITNETQQSVSVSSETTQAEVTYASLADQGLTDTQIVSQLKAEGASATDILKSATALDRDMVSVAGAMQEAGFSNVDIATAYIAKASDWAVEKTVDVVNCAVQSLAEVLTGVSDIGNAVTDLAYEVIVSDIMQSGEVNIQDGQIMSSMNAIKEVASEHGVELQGTNATVADLENMQGSAIVHLDDNHWAVVTDISGDSVTLMDNGTEVTMSKAELQARWDGNMLTQENTSSTQLTYNQMIQIVGADIGGENGDSFGGGQDNNGNDVGGDLGGHDNNNGNGDNSDQAGGDYGSPNDGLNGMQSAGNSLSSWGDEQGGVIGGIASAIGSGLSAIGNGFAGISNAVSNVGDTVKGWGQNLSDWGKSQTGIVGTVVGWGARALGAGISAIGSTVNAIGRAPEAIAEGVTSMVGYAVSTPVNIAKGAYNTVKGIATLDLDTTIDGIKDLSKGLAKAALGPFGMVGVGVYSAGKTLTGAGDLSLSLDLSSNNNTTNTNTNQPPETPNDHEGGGEGGAALQGTTTKPAAMTDLQNSLVNNPNQTVLTMIDQGYSISEIKAFYVENNIDSGYTDRIIKSQVGKIVEAETAKGKTVDAIAGLFNSDTGKEHTTTLARHLILSGFSAEQVTNALLNIGADTEQINQGIKQAENILLLKT